MFAAAVGMGPARPLIGGIAVVAMTLIVGDRLYNGLSLGLIEAGLFGGDVPTWAFLAKMAFTVVTLGSGFIGGEVTPLFVIGTTLGATLAGVLDVPVPLLAAMGFVAVFAGAANTPLGLHDHGGRALRRWHSRVRRGRVRAGVRVLVAPRHLRLAALRALEVAGDWRSVTRLRQVVVAPGTPRGYHGPMDSDTAPATDLSLEIDGMTCSSSATRIEKKLNRLEGVEATVNYATDRARVHHDSRTDLAELIATVESTGYAARVAGDSASVTGAIADEPGLPTTAPGDGDHLDIGHHAPRAPRTPRPWSRCAGG